MRGGHDLVIDTQYAPQHFKKIYGNLNVSSFKDVYSEILYDETLSFLEKNGVQYYFFESPHTSKIKNLDDFEKNEMRRKGIKISNLYKYEDFVRKCCAGNQDVIDYCLTGNNRSGIFYNGRYNQRRDCTSKYFNVKDGVRLTHYVPDNPESKIYCFGPCTAESSFVPDKYTIESYLQKNICEGLDKSIEVVNCGVGGDSLENNFEYMLNTNFNPGDIVVHIRHYNVKRGPRYFETSQLFDRPHNYGYWMFDNGFHVNHVGNEVIANYIYDVLKPQLSKSSPKDEQKTVKYQFENEVDTFLDDNPDFKRYLDGLKSIKVPTETNGKVGSIVMNCNPFTLGHRYLIEQAAAQVDHLYIFVVEEDKSVFPFEDRMKLVKEGTADLGDKVTVLPSGKWIISLLTFPEYFNKDDLQGAAIDPSKDINLFGKYIAPTLGINMRFVGEEPFDKVTRQYNETMRNILPSFEVSFQEIPRKSTDGKDDVISATKVRNALKAGDFENLKKYVPKTTLIYLKENYEQIVARINSKYKK